MDDKKMNVNEQVGMILSIANQLRGPFKEDEYQNVIIPMTICRRFECILEKTKSKVVSAFESGITNDKRLKFLSEFSIYNTSRFSLKTLLDDPSKIASNFKDYLEHYNDTAKQIFVQMKFFDTIDAMEKGKKLYQVIKKFSNADLSTEHVSSMQMGYIMEEIIRTYSENASAGDHFTPREVIRCLTKLLLAEGCDDLFEAGKIVTIGDFACGTGGMLSEGYRMIKQLNSSTDVELFGQDNNGWYEGIAEAEMIIKGQNPEHVKLVESTLTTDAFPDNKVRLVLMNPPFGLNWSKKEIGDEQFSKILEQNRINGWYPAGVPSSADSQMLFWQYALNKMDDQKGRGAIICNASPLFSGGTRSGESNIRKYVLENDWIEAIIQFCPELFYNTGISIYAIIFNKNKSPERKNKIQLIDATSFCSRMSKGLGFKRNQLTESHIDTIVKEYSDFKNDDYSKIYEKEDFYYREVISQQPYQRTFSITESTISDLIDSPQFMNLFDDDKYQELLDLPARTQLQNNKIKEIEEGKALQETIVSKLKAHVGNQVWKNRDLFTHDICCFIPEIKGKNKAIKAIVYACSKIDELGDVYKGKNGKLEADSDLRDVEIVPYKENVDEYYKREVLPFAPKTWYEIQPENISVGCEINFNKYFYKYSAPESSKTIMLKIKEHEKKEKELMEDLFNE
jgi:type I restriction enzyme M protein